MHRDTTVEFNLCSHARSTVVCVAPDRARVPRVDERAYSLCVCTYIHEHDVRTSTRPGRHCHTAQPRIYASTDPRDYGTVRIRTGIRAGAHPC